MSERLKKRMRLDDEHNQPGPSNKMKKVGPSNEEPIDEMAKTIERKKSCLLNFDCLAEVFMELSKPDLMATFDADEEFSDAVRYVMKTKFSKDIFDITNDPHFNEKGESTTVKKLAAFGDKLRSVSLIYDHNFREYDKLIENAIIEHCRTSLHVIRFVNALSHAMIGITEPFTNIVEVLFLNSEFGKLVSNFSKWFPIAHTLQLCSVLPQTAKQRKLLEKTHPAVKQFFIKNSIISPLNKKITTKSLIKFIQLNPQLTNLTIFGDGPEIDGLTFNDNLATAIGTLEDLESLKILHQNNIIYNLDEIHCKKLKNLTMHAINTESVVTFPISFDYLDVLTFSCITGAEEELCEILDRCSNVRVIYLTVTGLGTVPIFEAFSRIPTLERLQLTLFRKELPVLKQNIRFFVEESEKLDTVLISVLFDPDVSTVEKELKDIGDLVQSNYKWKSLVVKKWGNLGPLLALNKIGAGIWRDVFDMI